MDSSTSNDQEWDRKRVTALLVDVLLAIAHEWEARALLLARERM